MSHINIQRMSAFNMQLSQTEGQDMSQLKQPVELR
jgi:hypothetical protein